MTSARSSLEIVPPGPVVSLRGVGKTYGAGKTALRALAAIDLDIAAGEVTILMGPSGSGKTTLLSIIGCILRPTAGEVRLLGQEVAEENEAARSALRLAHIGFIFQGYNLFPTLSARQNVELALDLKGLGGRARRRRADELLEQVGLGDKGDAYPADLSGGQKQRVAIARALAGEPSLILADEPTAALDLQTGRRIMMLFADLAHRLHRGVVVVTHDSRILDLADRVVTLEDGRIIRDIALPRESAPAAPLDASLLRRRRSRETDLKELVAS
ncbi:MAG TPA: ABC transporter ATP-binding protein [Stellaceae bacterium]|nr:ABC transporter ATP-binding protein [Stellaceae bacterium]